MRELWGRTWEMFRRNPVLWVPVIVADLVGHTLEAVRPMITANLVRWSMETHSVLGVTEYREAPGWLYWVVGLIRFGVWWVGACAYVVAAIVAAGMVRRLAEPKVEIAERKLPGLTYSVALPGWGYWRWWLVGQRQRSSWCRPCIRCSTGSDG
jgi:hypothetical protein